MHLIKTESLWADQPDHYDNCDCCDHCDDCDGDTWPAFVVGLFVISASGDQLKLEEAGGEAMHFQVVEIFKS